MLCHLLDLKPLEFFFGMAAYFDKVLYIYILSFFYIKYYKEKINIIITLRYFSTSQLILYIFSNAFTISVEYVVMNLVKFFYLSLNMKVSRQKLSNDEIILILIGVRNIIIISANKLKQTRNSRC